MRWVASAAAVQRGHGRVHVLGGRCWGARCTLGFIPVHSVVEIVYMIWAVTFGVWDCGALVGGWGANGAWGPARWPAVPGQLLLCNVMYPYIQE